MENTLEREIKKFLAGMQTLTHVKRLITENYDPEKNRDHEKEEKELNVMDS